MTMPQEPWTVGDQIRKARKAAGLGFRRRNQKWDASLKKYVVVEKPRSVTLQLPENVIKVDYTLSEDQP